MDSPKTDELKNQIKDCGDVLEYLQRNPASFCAMTAQGYLEELFRQKNRTKKQVVKDSGLDPIYAYQILSGRKNGSRNKLLCLSLAMGLSAEEANRWLTLCGKACLYPRIARDAVLLYGLEKSLTVYQVDELLFQAGEPSLFSL